MTKEQKLQALCISMGDESPMLNVVLKWYSLRNEHHESDFILMDGKGEACFIDNTEEIPCFFYWNLHYNSLAVQSEELINFLYELI